jgi:alpha-beta hydrolase superfamily lysophospholipase
MRPVELNARGVRLAANLFEPEIPSAPRPAVVIVHGFGGAKESHSEFAAFLSDRGVIALTLDLRGHGHSGGRLDEDVLDDLGAALDLLADHHQVDAKRLVLRGSSLGGNLAVHAAARYPKARAVIAICPATEAMLLPLAASPEARQETTRLGLSVRMDGPGFARYLAAHDLSQAVGQIAPRPLLLVQARGDQTVPYQSTQALYDVARQPKRLLLLDGGDHRSAQHDPVVHRQELAWMRTALARRAGR